MTLIPYEHFSLSSRKSIKDLVTILSQNVAETALFSVFRKVHDKPFEGKFSENGFKLKRVVHYYNSFIPIVKGHFSLSSEGTNVSVQMFPHPISYFFVLAVTIFGLIFRNAVGPLFSKRTSFGFILAVVFGIVSYITVYCAF
jgi:hypothetical protein